MAQIGSEISKFKFGTIHLLLKHTSASLSINESYDKDVRIDMDMILNKIAPESESLYRHIDEGLDDMPAHIKCALLGNQVTIPFSDAQFLLGTWQGIWLGEHRDSGGNRKIIATIQGTSRNGNGKAKG